MKSEFEVMEQIMFKELALKDDEALSSDVRRDLRIQIDTLRWVIGKEK